ETKMNRIMTWLEDRFPNNPYNQIAYVDSLIDFGRQPKVSPPFPVDVARSQDVIKQIKKQIQNRLDAEKVRIWSGKGNTDLQLQIQALKNLLEVNEAPTSFPLDLEKSRDAIELAIQ